MCTVEVKQAAVLVGWGAQHLDSMFLRTPAALCIALLLFMEVGVTHSILTNYNLVEEDFHTYFENDL